MYLLFQVPPVWPLDGSDPSRWDELVSAPARTVLEARLRGEHPDEAAIRPVAKAGTALPPEERHMTYHCKPCGRALIGLAQYNVHLAGRKHRQQAARLRRLQQQLVDVLDAAGAVRDGQEPPEPPNATPMPTPAHPNHPQEEERRTESDEEEDDAAAERKREV